MSQPTHVEFYNESGGMLDYIEAEAVPRAGELISLRGVTWAVDVVSWAIDYPDSYSKRLCANVRLVEPKS